jgi:hypothetical protein
VSPRRDRGSAADSTTERAAGVDVDFGSACSRRTSALGDLAYQLVRAVTATR